MFSPGPAAEFEDESLDIMMLSFYTLRSMMQLMTAIQSCAHRACACKH